MTASFWNSVARYFIVLRHAWSASSGYAFAFSVWYDDVRREREREITRMEWNCENSDVASKHRNSYNLCMDVYIYFNDWRHHECTTNVSNAAYLPGSINSFLDSSWWKGIDISRWPGSNKLECRISVLEFRFCNLYYMLEQYKLLYLNREWVLILRDFKFEKKKTSCFHEMELLNLFKKRKGRFQNSFDFIFRMNEIGIFKSIEREQIEE